MAIEIGSAVKGKLGGSTNIVTVTGLSVPSGNNRILVAAMNITSQDISAITFDFGGSDQKTVDVLVNHENSGDRVIIGYLLDEDLPPAGGTYSVRFVTTGSTYGVMGVFCAENVKQQAPPYHTYATGNGQDTATNSLSDVLIRSYGIQFAQITSNNTWNETSPAVELYQDVDGTAIAVQGNKQLQSSTGTLEMETVHTSTGFVTSVMIQLEPAKIPLFPQINIV